MLALPACLALALACSVTHAGRDARVKKKFESDNYTVTWGNPPTYAPDAELELGFGNGHAGTLAWVRFRPGKDGVDVLSIRYDQGLPGAKKGPPDGAPVDVKRAHLKPEAYAALLRDLAIVVAANLKPVKRTPATLTSNDFWVSARLATGKRTHLDLDWAGYDGSRAEAEYAKPLAVVKLAGAVVQGLDFKEPSLTDQDRSWASARFARDWKRFEGRESHWWVRERYVITVGVVGDAAAYPTLRDILSGDPTDRCVYHAINAVTRLTGKDVRDKPVENMDIEKTRRKVLDLINDKK